MATDSEHLKGIALQAERVVAAYKAMREAAAKDKGGEFPVDEIGKLFAEVGQLEHWTEPAGTGDDTGKPADIGEQPAFGSASEANEVIDRVLDETHAIGDVLASSDRNYQLDPDALEIIGSMLSRNAKAAREARHWLAEASFAASGGAA